MRHITNTCEYYLFPLFKTENNGLLPSRLYLLHKMNMSHSVNNCYLKGLERWLICKGTSMSFSQF